MSQDLPQGILLPAVVANPQLPQDGAFAIAAGGQLSISDIANLAVSEYEAAVQLEIAAWQEQFNEHQSEFNKLHAKLQREAISHVEKQQQAAIDEGRTFFTKFGSQFSSQVKVDTGSMLSDRAVKVELELYAMNKPGQYDKPALEREERIDLTTLTALRELLVETIEAHERLVETTETLKRYRAKLQRAPMIEKQARAEMARIVLGKHDSGNQYLTAVRSFIAKDLGQMPRLSGSVTETEVESDVIDAKPVPKAKAKPRRRK